MNLEKIRNYQWFCAVIKREIEDEDDYLFTYDVDKAIEQYTGKLRIEKSLFEEAKDKIIDLNFIWNATDDNRIAMIRPCSKPLSIFDELPEFDYWAILMAERYLKEFSKTRRLPIKVWVEKENHQEREN